MKQKKSADQSLQFKRIVLIGFRGVGKTTIARKLSEFMNWNYISTDEIIEEMSGQNISYLVESQGWKNFRNLEKKAVEAIKDEMKVVIDCGGGVVENTQNMSVLAKQSLVIWIDADLEDILLRLSKDKNRPLLNQQNLEEDVKNNYHRRFPLYQFYAHYTYNSSRKSVDQICHFIRDRLMKR